MMDPKGSRVDFDLRMTENVAITSASTKVDDGEDAPARRRVYMEAAATNGDADLKGHRGGYSSCSTAKDGVKE